LPGRRQTKSPQRALRWQLQSVSNPFRYFNSSPEVIRLVLMMYVRFPLSLRNVEDLTPKRDKAAALKLLKRIMKKYGRPQSIVTDRLRAAAMKEFGAAGGPRENHLLPT
jgi:putative transposase